MPLLLLVLVAIVITRPGRDSVAEEEEGEEYYISPRLFRFGSSWFNHGKLVNWINYDLFGIYYYYYYERPYWRKAIEQEEGRVWELFERNDDDRQTRKGWVGRLTERGEWATTTWGCDLDRKLRKGVGILFIIIIIWLLTHGLVHIIIILLLLSGDLFIGIIFIHRKSLLLKERVKV